MSKGSHPTHIPLAEPDLSGNETRYLEECIKSTYVSSVGPFVERLEERVAEATGADVAVATSSGTAGLHVALTALGVKPSDIVILPDFTFIASANAISYCGAKPWLIDIDPNTWTIDPKLLENVLQAETRRDNENLIHIPTGQRIAAIMVVHTLGLPADMDSIVEVANRYKLPVVADAAAAIGATYKDRPIGALGATLNVLSFNGNKTLTTGGGGAVFGSRGKLIDLVRHLATTARNGPSYNHDYIGFNYRMTNLEAAVGCAQFERLDQLVAAKRKIRDRYDDAFSKTDDILPFPDPTWARSTCWLSGFALQPDSSLDANSVIARLNAEGIGARTFWRPIHSQTPYKAVPQTAQTICKNLWDRIVTLPSSSNISSSDQGRVIKTVLNAFNARTKSQAIIR